MVRRMRLGFGSDIWTIGSRSKYLSDLNVVQPCNNISFYYRFQLLKILTQFGEIVAFDMLFHRSGPFYGQPRGYAFATYKKPEDALRALTKLDGQKIGIKCCSIRFAKNVNYDEIVERPKPQIPVLAAGTTASTSRSSAGSAGNRRKDSTIQAIEAKLRMLENRRTDEFLVNSRAVASHQEAPIQNYQFNMNSTASENKKFPAHKRNHRPNQSRPYNRPQHPRR